MSYQTTKHWRTVPTATVLAYVADRAKKSGFVNRVVLFGSRARGEERPFSDYDLAFELAPGTPRVHWLAFAEKLDDEAPTLCQLSLVQLRPSVRPEMLERIAKEGWPVYER
jgi:predicted nucleotidyltransferase